MSLATRRKALPQSRCMLPGSWWHTDWQISNFEVWFKLLQAGQGILWIRISRRSSCILRAELLCRVQNADLVGRHHQAERERKVQHGTTSWTSLQWVCNPLTLKPQALSHQLCLSQGLDMSTDQTSSAIIHNHPQSSCFWGQSNCTLMGGTVAAFTWQMWPCKTVNCFAHLARICTNLMTQLRILCKSWNSDDNVMMLEASWNGQNCPWPGFRAGGLHDLFTRTCSQRLSGWSPFGSFGFHLLILLPV